jgi:hypothetical protein
MLSRVEYQARKPACDLVTRSVSSEQLFNLEFSIDVNNLILLYEYLKTTVTKFLPYYAKLFNLIFDSGESPDSWTLGIIKAIYKNKGDPNDPDNYWAISLVSSLGKLFTSILTGNKFSPCLTPISQVKKSENVCPDFTQDLILS